MCLYSVGARPVDTLPRSANGRIINRLLTQAG
jgi:hypothetical protein